MMAYSGYKTFKAEQEDAILTVTFDFGTGSRNVGRPYWACYALRA